MSKADRKDRFYWREGVFRSEVDRAMTDRRRSPLYKQAPRRLLVLCAALVIAALAFTIFISSIKLRTYCEVILTVLGLCLFAFLRQATRLVSEAPDELLDERLVALRDANFNKAYRCMVSSTILYGVLLALFTTGGPVVGQGIDRFWTGIALSYLLTSSSLPSMLLAWQLPSEVFDDETSDRPNGALN